MSSRSHHHAACLRMSHRARRAWGYLKLPAWGLSAANAGARAPLPFPLFYHRWPEWGSSQHRGVVEAVDDQWSCTAKKSHATPTGRARPAPCGSCCGVRPERPPLWHGRWSNERRERTEWEDKKRGPAEIFFSLARVNISGLAPQRAPNFLFWLIFLCRLS
jgi:hypothetical protein